jgi:hypothetical protein
VAKIPVICKKCEKEFVCDTEGNDGEAFKSLGSQIVIIERCTNCGHPNRITVPSSEG